MQWVGGLRAAAGETEVPAFQALMLVLPVVRTESAACACQAALLVLVLQLLVVLGMLFLLLLRPLSLLLRSTPSLLLHEAMLCACAPHPVLGQHSAALTDPFSSWLVGFCAGEDDAEKLSTALAWHCTLLHLHHGFCCCCPRHAAAMYLAQHWCQ